MAGKIFIGTSGWSYPHWKQTFYANIPQKQWLNFYSQQFNSVEINATFYRLQSASTFSHWHKNTPDDFRFVIKAHKYLTHNKKLLDPQKSIAIEQQRGAPLAEKLSIVLWQLPGSFQKNLDRLQIFAKRLQQWNQVRHVIEFRHDSWFDDEVASCLKKYDVANCLSDAADWPLWDKVTTNLVYVRLHGHTETYVSSYSQNSLKQWCNRIHEWHENHYDVFVYFNNDANASATRNAKSLMDLISID